MTLEDLRHLELILEQIVDMRNRLEEDRGNKKEAKRLDTIAGKIYDLVQTAKAERRNA